MTPKALSREIKFRVCNTDWKMMVLPEDIYYIKFQGEKSEATDVAFNITTTDGMRNNNIWENPEDIVFMQYTGLKDKNGKEIYENDFVKSKSHLPEVMQVEFIEGAFCMTHPTIEDYPIDINHFYPSIGTDLVVVGNIYESPDLLTKENK